MNTVISLAINIFTLNTPSKLAGILIRHAELANLKAVLNNVIPTPIYGGNQEDTISDKKDDSQTTLFREMVLHMPGQYSQQQAIGNA